MILCFRWRDFFFKGWDPNYSGTNIHMYYLPRWTNISWLVWIILKFHRGWKNGHTPPPPHEKNAAKKMKKERKYLCTISIPPVLNGAHSVFLHTRIHNTHWFFLLSVCRVHHQYQQNQGSWMQYNVDVASVSGPDRLFVDQRTVLGFSALNEKKTKGKYIYFFIVWICIHVHCVHILTLVQALRSDFN